MKRFFEKVLIGLVLGLFLYPSIILVIRPRALKLRKVGRAKDAEALCIKIDGHRHTRKGYCWVCHAGKDGPVLNADDLPAEPNIDITGRERYRKARPISPRQKRFWLVHHRWIAIFAYFSFILLGFYLAILVDPLFSLVGALLSGCGLVVEIATSGFEQRHNSDEVLCRWCGPEQARSRATVDTHRNYLWWNHHRLRLFGVGLCCASLLFLPDLIFLFTGPPPGRWILLVPLAILPIMAFGLWAVRINRVHRLLRPWCPFCKDWGDGGSPESIPDPDPSMTKVST